MALNLSVNLNKVALLRNARGGGNPSPLTAAKVCVENGAAGLTLHWREDNRHTKASDVRELCAYAKDVGVEFNLEGDERQELIDLALEVVPTQFTLVPVTPGEITSDHGWDLPRQRAVVAERLKPIAGAGIRTAIFMDPVAELMPLAAETGTDRVELYTEPYAAAWGSSTQQSALESLKACAKRAVACGMAVNAGHDLNLQNTPTIAEQVPEIVEVSIGHALLADALHIGLAEAIRRYVKATKGGRPSWPITR